MNDAYTSSSNGISFLHTTYNNGILLTPARNDQQVVYKQLFPFWPLPLIFEIPGVGCLLGVCCHEINIRLSDLGVTHCLMQGIHIKVLMNGDVASLVAILHLVYDAGKLLGAP